MARQQQVIHLETFLSLSVPSRVEAIILSRGRKDGRTDGRTDGRRALGSWRGPPSQPLCHCGRKLVVQGEKVRARGPFDVPTDSRKTGAQLLECSELSEGGRGESSTEAPGA